LADRRNDQFGLGNSSQNIGIVCQSEGEAARERGDEPAAIWHFEEACRYVGESLLIWQAQKSKSRESASLSQLARIHLNLGDFQTAERYAQEALEIREHLGSREACMDYGTLAEIAQAHGDLTAAAAWAKKRDDFLAELKRRPG